MINDLFEGHYGVSFFIELGNPFVSFPYGHVFAMHLQSFVDSATLSVPLIEKNYQAPLTERQGIYENAPPSLLVELCPSNVCLLRQQLRTQVKGA